MIERIPATCLFVALLGVVVAWRTGAVFEQGARPVAALLAPLTATALVLAVPHSLRPLRLGLQVVLAVGLTVVAVRVAGGDVPADVVDALVRGLSSNLALPWPVERTPVTIGGVVAVVALMSAASVELAAARVTGPVVALPLVALLALLCVLSAPAGAPSLVWMVLVLAAVLLVLRLAEAERRRARRRAAGTASTPTTLRRPSVPVVGTLAIAALAVVLSAAGLAGADRWNPRQRIDLPAVIERDISPLSLVDGWRRLQPAQDMFRITSGPAALGEPWRLVALTRYDGRSWMPSSEYRPTGRHVRVPPDGVRLHRSRVDLVDLRMLWLPAPADVVEVSEAVSTDASLGGLLVEQTPPDGFSYEVTSADLEPSTTAELAAPAGEILVDTVPPPHLIQLANELTADGRTDHERALLLAARLRRDYPLDPDAPAGHNLLVLDRFLQRQQSGREEQFVAAYAMLAAAVNLPVRVVVGFDPEPVADGAIARSSGARAWPEVEFVGAGWLAFDPVPEEPTDTTGADLDQPAPVQVEPLPGPQTPETTPPTTAPTPLDSEPPPTEGDGFFTASPAAVLPVVGLVAIAAYLAGVLWWKERRRRSRRSVPPERQVTGAFRSGVETLVDLGAPARPSATNRELVAAGAPAAAGQVDELAHLADLASAAAFAGRPPDDRTAEAAWQRLEEFERTAATSVGRLRWLRARLSLRSLRRDV